MRDDVGDTKVFGLLLPICSLKHHAGRLADFTPIHGSAEKATARKMNGRRIFSGLDFYTKCHSSLAASSLRVRFYTTFLHRVFSPLIRVIIVHNLAIVTFCRVSGLSPFMGDTDLETMANVTIAEYDYEDEAFDNVSKEAKDFIDRLLVKEQP